MYHSSVIEDIQWRPNQLVKGNATQDLMLASLETSMMFQVWQMKDEFASED